MLRSMTGFGRAEQTAGDKTFLIDIKSLNGKQFELQLKMPAFLKPFEFDIRKLLSEKLTRGSVDCTISLKDTGQAKPISINTSLAKAYYKPLAELSAELGLDTSTLLSTIIKLPEVITPSSDTLNDAEWNGFKTILQQAIDNVNDYRLEEGKVLQRDLQLRMTNILEQQKNVAGMEPLRQQKIRDGLKKLLEDAVHVQPDVVVVVLVVVPKNKKQLVWRCGVPYIKGERRFVTALPGLAGNGDYPFVQVNRRAGKKEEAKRKK